MHPIWPLGHTCRSDRRWQKCRRTATSTSSWTVRAELLPHYGTAILTMCCLSCPVTSWGPPAKGALYTVNAKQIMTMCLRDTSRQCSKPSAKSARQAFAVEHLSTCEGCAVSWLASHAYGTAVRTYLCLCRTISWTSLLLLLLLQGAGNSQHWPPSSSPACAFHAGSTPGLGRC